MVLYHDWMILGYVLFVFLNVIDLLITNVILNCGGKEWNFVARFLYKRLGIKGIGLLKILMLTAFGVQCYFGTLDLYAIWYLDFMFTVVLGFMYKDAVDAGLKSKLHSKEIFKLSFSNK